MQTLQMEIASYKKSVRKELERNEMLTVTLQYRESDIARCERELKDADEKKNSLLEETDVIKKIIEMTENELIFLNDVIIYFTNFYYDASYCFLFVLVLINKYNKIFMVDNSNYQILSPSPSHIYLYSFSPAQQILEHWPKFSGQTQLGPNKIYLG